MRSIVLAVDETPVKPRLAGKASPLGATVSKEGVNFSLYSRTASGVELLLFEREDDAKPTRVIRIPPHDRTLPLLA